MKALPVVYDISIKAIEKLEQKCKAFIDSVQYWEDCAYYFVDATDFVNSFNHIRVRDGYKIMLCASPEYTTPYRFLYAEPIDGAEREALVEIPKPEKLNIRRAILERVCKCSVDPSEVVIIDGEPASFVEATFVFKTLETAARMNSGARSISSIKELNTEKPWNFYMLPKELIASVRIGDAATVHLYEIETINGRGHNGTIDQRLSAVDYVFKKDPIIRYSPYLEDVSYEQKGFTEGWIYESVNRMILGEARLTEPSGVYYD